MEPAALELSLAAAAHLEQDRIELDALWQQRLERAQFDTDRARRHYQRVEPENRFVARQLAHDWEAALQAQQRLQEDYQRFCQAQPKRLSPEEKQQIQQLADSLPTLWAAPTTTLAQRKDVIRQMIDRILISVVGDTEQVQVTIAWAGSVRVRLRSLARSPSGLN